MGQVEHIECTNLTEDQRLFVQKNTDYYNEKWTDVAAGKFAFNIAAFFFPILWIGYRKMYHVILIIALLYLFLDIFLLISPQNRWLDLMDSFYELGLAIFFGFRGNKIYQHYVTRRVNMIKETVTNEQEKKMMLYDKGGGSGSGILVAVLITVITYTMPIIYISYLV